MASSQIWVQGGPSLAARAGMREMYEVAVTSHDAMPICDQSHLDSHLAHTLMLTLNATTQRMNIFACGVYLMHSSELNTISMQKNEMKWFILLHMTFIICS